MPGLVSFASWTLTTRSTNAASLTRLRNGEPVSGDEVLIDALVNPLTRLGIEQP
jgi:hypothetical protein